MSQSQLQLVLSTPKAQRATALGVVWPGASDWLDALQKDPSAVAQVPQRLLPLLFSCMADDAVTACQRADKRQSAALPEALRITVPAGLSHRELSGLCQSPPFIAALLSGDPESWESLASLLQEVTPVKDRASWAASFTPAASSIGSQTPAYIHACRVFGNLYGFEQDVSKLPPSLAFGSLSEALRLPLPSQVVSLRILDHDSVRSIADAFSITVKSVSLISFVKTLPKSSRVALSQASIEDPLWGLIVADGSSNADPEPSERFFQYADTSAVAALPFLSQRGQLSALCRILLDSPLYAAPQFAPYLQDGVLDALVEVVFEKQSLVAHRAAVLLSEPAPVLDRLRDRDSVALIEAVYENDPRQALDLLSLAPRRSLVAGVKFIPRLISSDERAASLASAVLADVFDNNLEAWQLLYAMAPTWKSSLDDLTEAVSQILKKD